VPFSGVDDLADALPPARRGGPPLWLAGGDSAKVVERVANTYDDWLPLLPHANAYRRARERIQERAIREITPALHATVNINGDQKKASEELDTYTRAYYRQSFEAMRQLQAFRGSSVFVKPLGWES
jgi:alkanesulfonate monooxygenase SsuD/methylene tetrahydromethanopterin reductase-like flavin-dependent oxidoreductase (luciferase family)